MLYFLLKAEYFSSESDVKDYFRSDIALGHQFVDTHTHNTHTLIHTHTHTYTHTLIHTHTHTHTHTPTHTNVKIVFF